MRGTGSSEGQAQAIAATLRASHAFTTAAVAVAAALACLKRTHTSMCTSVCILGYVNDMTVIAALDRAQFSGQVAWVIPPNFSCHLNALPCQLQCKLVCSHYGVRPNLPQVRAAHTDLVCI